MLEFLGRGHTEGDIVAWLPEPEILFAGDLVESQAALYTGDAFHFDWAGATLDRVAALGARQLVGGRGAIARGRDEVDAAVEQTRDFLLTMQRTVGEAHRSGGTLKDAFRAIHAALAPAALRGPPRPRRGARARTGDPRPGLPGDRRGPPGHGPPAAAGPGRRNRPRGRRAEPRLPAGLPVSVHRMRDLDPGGTLITALGARPDECWVLRPDAHVAAVATSADEVARALSRPVDDPVAA